MNREAKLDRKLSENLSASLSLSSPNKKKRRLSSRNPLKDLNSTCVNPQVSGEAPKGGYFSLFSSNSSSSRSQLRTPRLRRSEEEGGTVKVRRKEDWEARVRVWEGGRGWVREREKGMSELRANEL